MPSVVLDASSLVGALLKEGSVPERAFLLARASATICLSETVEAEIREVFARPKFKKYLAAGRSAYILAVLAVLAVLAAAARRIEPTEQVTDCRDAKDNKYLELALAAEAETIIYPDSLRIRRAPLPSGAGRILSVS